MTMRSVHAALAGLVLICGGCAAAAPPGSVAAAPPAVAASPQSGAVEEAPNVTSPAADPWGFPGSAGWHGGWLHFRI